MSTSTKSTLITNLNVLKYGEPYEVKDTSKTTIIDLIKLIEPGKIKCYWYNIINNALGLPIYIPIIIVRGNNVINNNDINNNKYKILGINAVLHGDEINGIRIIQELFDFILINN